MADTSASPAADYPVTLTVEYPDRQLDRLSTAFRIIWIIPIAILFSLFDPAALTNGGDWDSQQSTLTFGGLIVLPTLLMIVARQKYPRWWFDFNVELSRLSYRISAYLTLMRDEYPSTDEKQSVHFDVKYPDVPRDLNRWLPLVKWFLAIPHYIVLVFLVIGVVFAVIYAWFAILFTGIYPRAAFDYVLGVMRWGARVSGYAVLLVTDIYPPFTLDGSQPPPAPPEPQYGPPAWRR